MSRVAGLATLLLASAASAQPAGQVAGPIAGPVTVDAAWARATTGGDTGAAYVTLTGHGTPARLVGVRTPDADMAMLHVSAETGGLSQMRDIDGLNVPAQGSAAMRPGGVHIMLMGLHHPLRPGDRLPLTLTFADGQSATASAIVGGPGAMVSPAP